MQNNSPIPTSWLWSIESEGNRILQAAHNIGNGFYTQNGFTVTSDQDRYTQSSVNIPLLPYRDIPDFWLKVRDIDFYQLPALDPHHLEKDLVPHLTAYKVPDMAELKGDWEQNNQRVLSALKQNLPTLAFPHKLNIYPTHFGTISSFNHSQDGVTTLFLRKDATIYDLVEGVISSLLRPVHIQQGLSWTESEAVIDHILLYSPLSTLLKEIRDIREAGTLPALLQKEGRVSTSFLAQIGAPGQTHSFSTKEEVVLLDGAPLHHLTAREAQVLCKLIELRGQTLTYDNLADLIFESEDEFSLTTISKTIERLRQHLEQNGVSSSVIKTERGLGYYLRS